MAEPAAPAEPAAAVEQEEEEEEHDDKEEEAKGRELLQACQAGDAERVQALLREGAPPYYQARGLLEPRRCADRLVVRSLDRSIVLIQLAPPSYGDPFTRDLFTTATGARGGDLLPDAGGAGGPLVDCAGAADGGRALERAGPPGEVRGGARHGGDGGAGCTYVGLHVYACGWWGGKTKGPGWFSATQLDEKQAQAVVDALVDHAVVAEMLLGAATDNEALEAQRLAQAAESEEYLGETRFVCCFFDASFVNRLSPDPVESGVYMCVFRRDGPLRAGPAGGRGGGGRDDGVGGAADGGPCRAAVWRGRGPGRGERGLRDGECVFTCMRLQACQSNGVEGAAV